MIIRAIWNNKIITAILLVFRHFFRHTARLRWRLLNGEHTHRHLLHNRINVTKMKEISNGFSLNCCFGWFIYGNVVLLIQKWKKTPWSQAIRDSTTISKEQIIKKTLTALNPWWLLRLCSRENPCRMESSSTGVITQSAGVEMP